MSEVPLKSRDLFDVTGLATIVTGGASGIGLADGQVMATNGAAVTLIDRDAQALVAATNQLSSGGNQVRGETADVTDKAALCRAVDVIAQRHGRIDVAFANAGISAGPGFLNVERQRDPQRALENIPDDLWKRVIDTNLTSVFHTIQVVVPHMKARGGRIIVTSSISATQGRAIRGYALCGGQGRRRAARATGRAGACSLQHLRQCDRTGAMRNQYRWRPIAGSRQPGVLRTIFAAASHGNPGRHAGRGAILRVRRFTTRHRRSHRDRRRRYSWCCRLTHRSASAA